MPKAPLIDQYGNAISRDRIRAARASAFGGIGNGMEYGYGGDAYIAGSRRAQSVQGWNPRLNAADNENMWARDRVVARSRDLERNDGWAAGAVSTASDSVIGGDLRLKPKPHYKALQYKYGPAFDSVWAKDFSRAVAALWREYADDENRCCDMARKMTVSQMWALQFRTKMIEGEALGVLGWKPDRVRKGLASYATVLSVIDPDRLSNPHMALDRPGLRGGVETDADGAAIAYHIRQAHPADFINVAKSASWERVQREQANGRPVVIHDMDHMRGETTRPAGGIFTPIVARLKQITHYDETELQAAILNATFAAFIESSNDPQDTADGLRADDGDEDDDRMSFEDRLAFHERSRLTVNGARIGMLAPGEKMNFLNAARPSTAYEPFQAAALRNIASAVGLTYEDLSSDWSRVNYSSARGAMVKAWKTLSRRAKDFKRNTVQLHYSAVLEEAYDRDLIRLGVMPRNAPDFDGTNRHAFSGAIWMGPPRGWIDPVKEAQAAILRMDAGLTTLVQECAEQGVDFEDMLDDRADVEAAFRERGLTLPNWAHVAASAASQKPDKEKPA